MPGGDMAAVDQTSLVRIEPGGFGPLELETTALDHSYEAGLISRLQAQDLSAFDELVSRFERVVYALCFRMLGDAEEARDAAQETFLKVFRGMSHFRGESGLKTWIYRIAINQAMNQRRWWRRRHRDETVSLDLSFDDPQMCLGNMIPGKSASPEETAIAYEREQRIDKALKEIKEEFRAVLILREVEEMTYEEIAETMRISVGTVKSRIARGREELRRKLKGLL